MTIADAAAPVRAKDPGGGEAEDPAPQIGAGPLNAPPFSWLGSDAWPNFPLWADKPT